MLSQIYAVLFVIFLVAGVIFQRHYMSASTQELELVQARIKSQTELMSAENFRLYRFTNGQAHDLIQADVAALATDGQLNLSRDIWFTRFEGDRVSSRLNTQSAVGLMQFPDDSDAENPFLSEGINIQRMHLPRDVAIYLSGQGLLEGQDMIYDFPSHRLQSDQPVTYNSRAEKLRGTAMTYNLKSEILELKGPVIGQILPGLRSEGPLNAGERRDAEN